MITDRLFRSPSPRHPDPARRLAAVADLPAESDELAELLATDPAPEVRAAAANRCLNLDALAAAWQHEPDPTVRGALAAGLGAVLAHTTDEPRAMAWLHDGQCTDAIRVAVARGAGDSERRRIAIAAIGEQDALMELALSAEHADTRMAAAERIHAPDALRTLADAARDKDRGVARLARKRLDEMANRAGDAAEADAIVAQLEALASKPGPILSAVIELNRRWQALDLSSDAERLERCESARQALQARFDREHAEQRARAQFEHRLAEWLGRSEPPASSSELEAVRSELAALRAEAQTYPDGTAAPRLDEAQQRIERWAKELEALAGAEGLVVEAEQLAAGTSIDDAKLPDRWQALERSIRTPALTRRFEAALITIEQRRLAHVRAAEQEEQAARHQLHTLLHTAEQALAAGQVQAAHAAVEEIRARRASAGALPKPTTQRLGRVTQQLKELERWESFGQHQARVQLCERAEAAAASGLEPPKLAVEVQNLRSQWTALDQQHAGVPKSLWERFDRACEKAYAPAARYFAEQTALRKQVRKQREDFIAAAAAHAPTLMAEPRDWRAIERWLRETDRRWHDGELGSVEPKAWKSLDARLKAALAPLRDALSAEREQAKARRVALIAEATALSGKALERDAPSQIKAIQARWQAEAKQSTVAQRDERVLWEQFRAACDAVFQAREAKRKQEDGAKHESRRALESLCAEVEALAHASDKDEQQVRRAARDLQEQWKQKVRRDPPPRGLEARFNSAQKALEGAVSARARAREAAVWQVLAAKERACEELDRLAGQADGVAQPAAVHEQWTALPALPTAWEKAMIARRDAALRALADDAARAEYAVRIQRAIEPRREMLLELELLLGLESPAQLQAQRRALQLKQLRDRFQGGATPGPSTAAERLVAWCSQPGLIDADERQRSERVFAKMERVR